MVDHRTLYGADPESAAYAESLAWARPNLTLDQPQLKDLFDGYPSDDTTTLLEVAQREWEQRSHMGTGMLPAGWRTERLVHKITLPATGWFVDIEASSSVAAVEGALGALVASYGIQHLTVAHLRGENRALTTAVANWVWHQVLDDGSLPLGIRFGSKHGSDWSCWAVWLRATDDGNPNGELTCADCGTEILDPEHNPSLQAVCDLFRLKIH